MKCMIETEDNLLFENLRTNGVAFRISVLPSHSGEEGVWIPQHGGIVAKFACSKCGHITKDARPFCPVCGARNRNPFDEVDENV